MSFPSCFYNYLDTSLFNIDIVFSVENNLSSIFDKFFDIKYEENGKNEQFKFSYTKKNKIDKIEKIQKNEENGKNEENRKNEENGKNEENKENKFYPDILLFKKNKKNSIHCAIYKYIYINICPYPMEMVLYYHDDHLWKIKIFMKNKIFVNYIIYHTRIDILYDKNGNMIKYKYKEKEEKENNEITYISTDNNDGFEINKKGFVGRGFKID